MSSPLSFLVEHQDTILNAYRENNAKPKNAWRSLERDLPELSRAMTFNTFKQYVSVFAFVKTRLDKVRQAETEMQLSSLENEKTALEEELRRIAGQLDKVTQDRDEILEKLRTSEKALDKAEHGKKPGSQVIQKLDINPKRISGWSVQRSKDGYYRCYRKIGGRVHSIYLGKKLDVKDAENRIKAKEKSLEPV